MRRHLLVATLVAALASGGGLHAYLKLGNFVGGRIVPAKWSALPVRYFVTNRDVSGVTAVQLSTAVASAFATWASVPTAAVSSQFVGFTSAEPTADDGVSVIGFQSRPDLERTLGATSFTLDTVTGAVLQSDIFLNSAFSWSVTDNGTPQRYDTQSVVLHEIGHLFGLGHSALGETVLGANGVRQVLAKRSVMFPFAYAPGTIADRTLQADDASGLSDFYGTDAARVFGGATGRVTLDGAGVFGAHVTALNTRTGDLIGKFALGTRGEFVLAGLSPGIYAIRAEPLDDAAVGDFFAPDAVVNVNFKPAYYAKIVAVQSGAQSGGIEIKVAAK